MAALVALRHLQFMPGVLQRRQRVLHMRLSGKGPSREAGDSQADDSDNPNSRAKFRLLADSCAGSC